MGEADEPRVVALRLLTRREHSRRELAGKLAQRGFPAGDIETVLDALERERLLSDARFAESYARSRCERGYGPQRIVAELGERGVDEALAREALATLDVDWVAEARRQRERRFGSKLPDDAKGRAQQQRFLYYRGFGSEHIRYALKPLDE